MINNEDLPAGTDVRRLPSPDRNLAVTPLEMRQAKLTVSMRGYDRNEVNSLLLEAADGYEQALRENERLRQEVMRLETSLVQYRDLEGALKNALMSAQKVSDDMRENANQEAARIVREGQGRADLLIREAQGRADLIIQKTEAQLEDIQREIDGLRLKRRESESTLESIIAALHNTLEFVREQEQREQRVVPHRPREVVASA